MNITRPAMYGALLLTLVVTGLPAMAAVGGCNENCLRQHMDQYLNHMVQQQVSGLSLSADAVLRENTAPVNPGEGVWKLAKAVRARQDFPDPVSGQIWSFLGLELQSEQIAQVSVRLRVAAKGRISEVETIVNSGPDGEKKSPYPGGPFMRDNVLEPDVLFTATVPKERRSTREELVELANGYFEGLGTADPGAIRFGVRCQRFESGAGGGINLGTARGRGGGAAAAGAAAGARGEAEQPAPRSNVAPNGYAGGASMCGGSLGGSRQTTIERRFPVAIPELGVVVGYMFIMHHERTPPQDNFINEIFKVVDGKIRQIDAVGFQLPAPARSGYSADLPLPGVLRSMTPEMTAAMYPAAASAAPATPQRAAGPLPAGPGGAAPAGGRGGGPQLVANMPKPPYAGISEAREIVYGPDPKQRMDILYPTARAAKPRAVLIFVHGGGWAGGDKHAQGDDLYENVVLWAAQQGMVGVNVNYRLADNQGARNLYPVGEQDVGAAVDWVGAHVQQYGGNPQRMFLWGHSAGGSHVASYASNPLIYGRDPLVKGIFLLSSPVDMTIDFDQGRGGVRYYGTTREEAADHSPLRTLATSRIPVLLGYSSDETGLVPMHFEKTRQVLCDAGHCPTIVFTKGSHQGEMMAVGTDDRSATDALLKFIASVP